MRLKSPIKKGLMIWQIRLSYDGDPAVYAEEALRLGLDYVTIKVANGPYKYNLKRPFWTDTIVGPLVDALRSVGILVGGWHYLYGSNPAGEADRAVQRIQQFGLDFYELDAESQYRDMRQDKQRANMRTFFGRLRAQIGDDYPLGACSYRYPIVHHQLCWDIFLANCNYYAPQVYWVQAHNPAEQLARSLSEYRDVEKRYGIESRPFYPVGCAYPDDHSLWVPTPAELDAFDAKAQDLGLPGVMWYRWGTALSLELDGTIASHDWGDDPPTPPDPPTVPISEWVLYADEWIRENGYDGPRPIA